MTRPRMVLASAWGAMVWAVVGIFSEKVTGNGAKEADDRRHLGVAVADNEENSRKTNDQNNAKDPQDLRTAGVFAVEEDGAHQENQNGES